MTAMTETTATSENASSVTIENKSEAKNFYRRCKKELREEDGGEIVYEMVEDEVELAALGKIFSELMDEDTRVEF